MRILFLAHRIPYPPNKGEKIRAFHELRFLAANHSIDLFCFADDRAEAEEQWNLRSYCRRIYVETRSPFLAKLRMARSFLKGEPLSNGFFYSPRFESEVRRALACEDYDVILVYCSSMAQYIPARSPAPVVVDFVDVDSAKWAQYVRLSSPPLSWLYAREARSLARAEQSIARSAAVAIVTTDHEATELRAPGCTVETVGNGVAPAPISLGNDLPKELRSLQPYVLFVGQMDYRPNIDAVSWFAKEMLPLVRAKCPTVKFVIAGRHPSTAVQQLAQLPGVVVAGAIPEVHPYLEGAAAIVAPFRIAQGIQNKILEALAARKPVVSTRKPAEAIGAKHGETLLIADTPAEFASAVVGLLEDPNLAQRFAGGPEFVRQNFDWQVNLRRLEKLLEAAVHHAIVRSPEESARVETQ